MVLMESIESKLIQGLVKKEGVQSLSLQWRGAQVVKKLRMAGE